MSSFLLPQRQLYRSHARSLPAFIRHYSAAPPAKASVKLIAEIRKAIPGTSLVKAREALEATTNDLPAALSWLEKDIAVSGAAKAAKLDGRTTGEGIIAVAVLSPGGFGGAGGRGVRAAMIELNCETDFVARNGLFVKLAEDISHTAAFLAEPRPRDLIQTTASPEELADAPLILSAGSPASSSISISESIRNSIARLGEKISLRRVCTVVADPLRDPTYGLLVSSHIHGGRVGSLVGLGLHSNKLSTLGPKDEESLSKIGKALAMQVAGFNPETIRGASHGSDAANSDSTALYDQPVMMMAQEAGDLSVEGFLKKWAVERGLKASEGEGQHGLDVVQFERWSVGA